MSVKEEVGASTSDAAMQEGEVNCAENIIIANLAKFADHYIDAEYASTPNVVSGALFCFLVLAVFFLELVFFLFPALSFEALRYNIGVYHDSYALSLIAVVSVFANEYDIQINLHT